MIADLAVAPFPRSLVKPPLRRLGEEHGLPPLGDYHIKLLRGSNRGDAAAALAIQVLAAFRDQHN